MTPITSSVFSWAYRVFAKPIFFSIDPETIHHFFVKTGSGIGANPVLRQLTKLLFSYSHPKLEKTIDGIHFPNPVGLSAGYDYNGELTDIIPAVGFGWHTIGTVTLEPYEGNPKPRLGRLPNSKALLVNKGLKNWGAKEIIAHLSTKQLTIPTGISIASSNKHFNSLKSQLLDIAHCFTLFEKSTLAHAYYELNISCPNTFGGEPFTDPNRLNLLLNVIDRLQIAKPVYLKMPIDQSEAETLAMLQVAAKHAIQGLIFGNLTKDHSNPAIHPEDKKIWDTFKANVSGKPTWERSNNLLRLAKTHFGERFTLIGTGGIFSPEDAQTKLDLGADLVQLITGMIFQGPQVIGQINQKL